MAYFQKRIQRRKGENPTNFRYFLPRNGISVARYNFYFQLIFLDPRIVALPDSQHNNLNFLKMALVHQFSSSSIWNKLVYCSLHTSSKPAFFRLDVFSKQKIWTADGWALCTQSQSCVSQLTILGHICPFSDNIQGQMSETETLKQSAAYYLFIFLAHRDVLAHIMMV